MLPSIEYFDKSEIFEKMKMKLKKTIVGINVSWR